MHKNSNANANDRAFRSALNAHDTGAFIRDFDEVSSDDRTIDGAKRKLSEVQVELGKLKVQIRQHQEAKYQSRSASILPSLITKRERYVNQVLSLEGTIRGIKEKRKRAGFEQDRVLARKPEFVFAWAFYQMSLQMLPPHALERVRKAAAAYISSVGADEEAGAPTFCLDPRGPIGPGDAA